MKNFRLPHLFLFIALLAGFLLNSCDKDPDNPSITKYDFFVSNEIKSTLTSKDAIAKLTTFQVILPETSIFGLVIKNDVDIHKLVYKTSFKKEGIQASGLVCVPKTPGDYPILCFQNGTNTENRAVPSENPKDELYQILESVASMGFIVVMPDYIGFGASSKLPHPYLQKESTTQSIIDMLRAVKEFSTQEKILAKPTKDLFLFGYSQGGWATMALQKDIEQNYASEFNLMASSCAAGPYSITYMNEYVTGKLDYPMPYFLAYVLNSYILTGQISNPISEIFQAPFATKIPGLFDKVQSGGTINSQLTTQMANLLTPEYKTGFSTNSKFAGIRSAFVANSIEPWLIKTPTRLYHGQNDEYIPVSLSQKMAADFKTKGVTEDKIKLVIIPGYDHPTGVIPVGFQTILWFLEFKK
jgi:pimeloyl-ACP methyl ester carboxylesterase